MSDVNKPEDCMLSFNLNIGATPAWIGPGLPAAIHLFGYLADRELLPDAWPFGKLTLLQNETDITKFSYFVWDNDRWAIVIRASSDDNQAGYQKMENLFAKGLIVTFDSVDYKLGYPQTVIKQPEFVGTYNNDDARKLGDLLQQNVDKTLHFCFNWK